MLRLRYFILILSILNFVPTNLHAEETPVLLETLYITADKRNENIHEQTRSATVIKNNDLNTTLTEPSAGIARKTPGVLFSGFGQPGTDFLNIRGVGPLGYPLSASDHTVAYSVSEVPTSTFGFAPSLFDMKQIEVVRGPQGTLFGRNSLAGGINFVPYTADGTDKQQLTFEAGSDGHMMTDAVAGGWLIDDKVAGRLALRLQDFDGDVPNTIAEGTEGGSSLSAARFSLTGYTDTGWDLSAMLQMDNKKSHNSYLLYYEHPSFPEGGDDRIPTHTRDNRQIILTAKKDLNIFHFTSLTGLQNQKMTGDIGSSDAYLNAALTGLDPSNFMDPNTDYFLTAEEEDIFSQELRITSNNNGALSWVAGVNYFQSNYNGQRNAESVLYATSNGITNVDIDTKSWSVFTDATWSLSERVRLSGGIRHGSEKQTVDGDYRSNGFPGTVPHFQQANNIEENYTIGRVGISYDISPSTAGYISWSQGFAAGGFEKLLVGSATGTKTEPFSAATNNTWETGVKYVALDDKANFNLALFHNDVKNGQMFDYSFDGGTVNYIFTNQDYRSWGAEFDGAYQFTDRLRMYGSLTLLNSEMHNVSTTTYTGAENGNNVPLTPKKSLTLGADYLINVDHLSFTDSVTLAADWSYVGKRSADIGNNFTLPSYDIVNSRLTWQRNKTSFSMFANNLFDSRPAHYASEYTPDIHTASVGTGRIIGLSIKVGF